MQGGAYVQEDISEKGRIALEKAGFDPMKVKEYMAVFNDHGDTSDIDQMNMDKVGLADAMAMVLASHDVENESTTEDSGELSRLKELSGLEEDDESYGYEWECSNCGTENEFVMTPQERAQYIKDWEADNQDLVANGETGENALNNLLDDTGEESGMHYGQKCMKCGTEAANPYQPMPEAEESNIEEDEDFEEVLGALGFPEDETELFDAEYQGRKVPLNKPMRGDTKKFKVYVKDPKTGNVKKVNFGHGGTSAKRKTMRIRKSNPKARKSFRARHNCANPGPKTKARYWSCRKW
jgi:DNA-directed RNA polymerase subunit RPC12/RpoP